MTIASGLVAMPADPKGSVGIVSYQHGTRVERSDVPSSLRERDFIYPALFGSHAGYMMVMPDYLGQGDNELMLHPYVQAQTLASSSIDMITAGKELARVLNYPINNKLFLTGYSEGGFSTIAMFDNLSKNNAPHKPTAVAVGSASYDWHEAMPYVLKEALAFFKKYDD